VHVCQSSSGFVLSMPVVSTDGDEVNRVREIKLASNLQEDIHWDLYEVYRWVCHAVAQGESVV
jgi:hypothetical protein